MPIPKSKPRQTGPKSDPGKKQASRNALQHGATASVADSQVSFELAQSYEQEMLAHYKAKNPLVKLQIQRIATTRAKLTQIYEQEQAKLALKYKEFDESPQLVIDSLKDVDKLAAGLALKIMKDGSYSLPRNILPEQIKLVAAEIFELEDAVLTNEDLEARS